MDMGVKAVGYYRQATRDRNRRPFTVSDMLARLSNPYWSPLHPTEYIQNCEGEYGPGVEFKSSAQVRLAWNIFWAMAYKLNTPRQVLNMKQESLHKVLSSAVNISRVGLVVEGTRFSLGQRLLTSSPRVWGENPYAKEAVDPLISKRIFAVNKTLLAALNG